MRLRSQLAVAGTILSIAVVGAFSAEHVVSSIAAPMSCAGNPVGGHCTPTEVAMAEAASAPAQVLPSLNGKAPMTRDQAVTAVINLTSEVKNVTSSTTKLTTLGAFQAAQKGATVPYNLDAGQSVWAVGVTGSITPSYAKSAATYNWAIVLIDPATGVVVSFEAGHETSLPGWFNQMVDAAT